jgi:3-hydroxy acid dehydrogenase/malonic semialdehyde reductase
MRLKNKVMFVTGATSGFGEQTVRLAVNEGARVIALGRRAERLDELQHALGKEYVLPVVVDVRDEQAVFAAMDALPEEWKEIDVLVANAGLALNASKAWDVPMTQWKQMIDTNINGLLYTVRAVLPSMLARNKGHIIAMGSMAGTYPYVGGNVYGGTKAFVQQFMMGLRCDLLGTNIRATNLEPGLAETEFALVRFDGDVSRAKELYAGTQPQRVG